MITRIAEPCARRCGLLTFYSEAPVGWPHIAKAMVDAGAVADLDTTFREYLADGGPAWVVKHALSPERGGGADPGRRAGVAVLAHPGSKAYGIYTEEKVVSYSFAMRAMMPS